jgi:flavodoxin I
MLAKIGLFYGSTTAKTDAIAELIRNEFGGGMVKLHCMAEARKEDFAKYEYLIIGTPTWGIGQLQIDWEAFFPELDEIDFSGKQVAYFGLGDQVGYPYNFLDAMGILFEKITSRGGARIGSWPAKGYNFKESKALINARFNRLGNGSITSLESKLIQLAHGAEFIDEEFVGLAIDEDNQPHLTEERISVWVSQIKKMMEI